LRGGLDRYREDLRKLPRIGMQLGAADHAIGPSRATRKSGSRNRTLTGER
jgi:hypothetical protein